MEKVITKLTLWAIIFDVFSVLCGVAGIVLGVYSLLALSPHWNDTHLSYRLTIIAIVFDALSCLFALLAFILGYRYFQNKRTMISKFPVVFKLEVIAIISDFMSFFLGLIGIVLETLSLLALLPSWSNESLSYNVTIGGVIFDILSALLIVVALYFVLRATQQLQSLTKHAPNN